RGPRPELGARGAAPDPIEVPRGKDPFPGARVEIPCPGVLGEVADAARALHVSPGGFAFSREDLRERGLSGAIAADEPDPVAGVNADRGARERAPGADGSRRIVGRDEPARARAGRRAAAVPGR